MFRVITDFGIHLWKATSQFSNLSQKFQMPILKGEFVSLTFNEELLVIHLSKIISQM